MYTTIYKRRRHTHTNNMINKHTKHMKRVTTTYKNTRHKQYKTYYNSQDTI